MAAILAGHSPRHHEALDPGPMVTPGTIIEEKISLPTRWDAALDAFDAGKVLPRYLGERYHKLYAHLPTRGMRSIPRRDHESRLRVVSARDLTACFPARTALRYEPRLRRAPALDTKRDTGNLARIQSWNPASTTSLSERMPCVYAPETEPSLHGASEHFVFRLHSRVQPRAQIACRPHLATVVREAIGARPNARAPRTSGQDLKEIQPFRIDVEEHVRQQAEIRPAAAHVLRQMLDLGQERGSSAARSTIERFFAHAVTQAHRACRQHLAVVLRLHQRRRDPDGP